MRTTLLIIVLTLTWSCNSQGFETNINAPEFIPNCSIKNSLKGVKVQEINNSYILLSTVQLGLSDCLVQGGIGYNLSKISVNGDTLYNSVFMHPDMATNNSGSLTPLDMVVGNDSSIYVLGLEDRWLQPFEPVFLSKHKFNGELIWKKSYPYSYLKPEALFIDDTTIFLSGNKKTSGNLYDVAIIKMDTSGTIEWSQYAQNGAFTTVSMIIKRSNDFIAIGNQIIDGSGTNNSAPFIVPFDENGVFPSSPLNFGNPAHNYIGIDAIYSYDSTTILAAHSSFYGTIHLFKIDDSNQQQSSLIYEPNYQIEHFYFTGIAQSADSNFVIVGQKSYLSGNTIYGKTIFIESFDESGFTINETEFAGEGVDVISNQYGEILIAGKRFNKEPGYEKSTSALLLKIDENGLTPDCLPHFFLNYYNSEFTDSLDYGGVIFVINNSDGDAENFYWTINGSNGPYGHNIYLYGYQPGWKVVTLHGCNQSYSDSLYINPNTAGVIESSIDDVIIYPNPSNDEFQISGFIGEINVYSIDGKKCFESTVNSKLLIECKNWKPGIYNVILKNDQEIRRRRIVKR